MADNILNVRLYDNPLTPEKNDYTGKVQLNGTLRNADIARKITEQRSELRYDTMLSVLNMADAIKRTGIATGYAVIDGVSQMRPSVTGRFDGAAAQYVAGINSKNVIMTPSHEMMREMEPAKVVVLGPAPAGPVINKVEDIYTGTENGVITPSRNLRIYGDRMRIAGDDSTVTGVWFVDASDETSRIRLDDRDLIDNDPSKLTIVVPALAAGDYWLEVVTQSSSNSKMLLKEPRTCRFEILLTVTQE